MAQDIVRVIRILEYRGPRDWVEKTLTNGAVPANGTHRLESTDKRITSRTLWDFPEIIGSTSP